MAKLLLKTQKISKQLPNALIPIAWHNNGKLLHHFWSIPATSPSAFARMSNLASLLWQVHTAVGVTLPSYWKDERVMCNTSSDMPFPQ